MKDLRDAQMPREELDRPDLFPSTSIEVDQRFVLSRGVVALGFDTQLRFSKSSFSLPLAISASFHSLMHFACDPISGVLMPETNGTPPPSNLISCPSQRNVSP